MSKKLNDTNFHSWRQKMEPFLGHREVDDMVDPTCALNVPKTRKSCRYGSERTRRRT